MRIRILAIVLGLQAVWILATSLVHETRLELGTVVRLETAPVDPRDLLRGDYVILNYRISSIDPRLFQGPAPSDRDTGRAIYVLLEPAGEFHQAVAASLQELRPSAGQVLLVGRCAPAWSRQRVEYGLERYYVAEGTGNPTGKLTVDVAVTRRGKGTIKEVYVDGRPYAQAMAGKARR